MSLVLLFAGGGVKSRRKEEEERRTEKEISTEGTRPEKEITDHRIRVQEGRTTKGQLREPESHRAQGTTKAAHKFILSCPRGQLSSQTRQVYILGSLAQMVGLSLTKGWLEGLGGALGLLCAPVSPLSPKHK